MPERFNSIKYKLLTGFLILTLNTIFLSSFSFYYFKRAEKIRILNDSLYELHIQVLQLMKLDNEFLNFGVVNNDFYRNRKSKMLIERSNLQSLIKKKQSTIRKEIAYHNFDLDAELEVIDSMFNQYSYTFESIILKVLERGFRDYGLEGELRSYAHALERDQTLKKEYILSLRRHEKDYFLRNDKLYSFRLDSVSFVLLEELNNNKSKNLTRINLLNKYRETFAKLCKVQDEIGFYNDKGLKYKLNLLNATLNSQFDTMRRYSNNRVATVIEHGTYIYILTVVFSIALTLTTSYLIASRLSRPIRKLSGIMDKFVMSNIKDDRKLKRRLSGKNKVKFSSRRNKLKKLLLSKDYDYSDEIRTLSDSFINLVQHTKDQFNEIQQKSKLLKEQNEELKKINVELDHFVYSAAHDLRSPLTSLLGLVQLISLETNQEMIAVYLSHMRKSILKLDSFIKDIVDYSKNNRVDIEVEEINIKEIINSCFEVQQFVPGTENLKRIVKIDNNFPFYSDKRRLTIILNNFISNGLRYSDPLKEDSFIMVRLIVNEDQAELSIEDNGIGIAENEIENIFKMFYRATETSKGSGLGLFIVKETINKLDGTITVISKPGRGTKFTITIPNHYEEVCV